VDGGLVAVKRGRIMKKIVNDYRIVVSGDEYNAPEVRSFHLQGEAAWAPGPNNKLTTSPIKNIDGDVVITRSGSVYFLGKRAEGFDTFAQLREKHPGVPLG
jgi:hypothetical protein